MDAGGDVERGHGGRGPAGAGGQSPRRLTLVRLAGEIARSLADIGRVAVEGEEVPAVAKSLGISVQAVYDAKYRIRRKVRQELDGLLE